MIHTCARLLKLVPRKHSSRHDSANITLKFDSTEEADTMRAMADKKGVAAEPIYANMPTS
jgi:hypothetical protein